MPSSLWCPRPESRRWETRVTQLLAIGFLAMMTHWHGTEAAVTGATATASTSPTFGGSLTSMTFTFTHTQTVPVNGAVVVVFPLYYVVENPTITALGNLDAACTVSMDPATRILTITVLVTPLAPASQTITLSGITHPGAGTTGLFSIRLLDASGNYLETSSGIPGLVITKNTITDATVTFASAAAGATTTCSVAFTTSIVLRPSNVLELEFPVLPNSKFLFSSATVTLLAGIPASSSHSVVYTSPFLRLVLGSGMTVIPAGTQLSFQFNGIINPAAQTPGSFNVRSRHSASSLLIFEEQLGITAPVITARTLGADTTFTPSTFYAGLVTSYQLSFTNAAYYQNGVTITLTVPSVYDLTSAILGTIVNMPATSAVFTRISSTSVSVTIMGGATATGTGRGFSVSNILNPGSSCDNTILQYCTPTYGTYSVSIADAGGNVYESTTTIPGTPILKSLLSFARVRPTKNTFDVVPPNTATTVTLYMTTQATIPIGGTIEVVFPAGFSFGAVAASGHVGIATASTTVLVTGQTVTLLIAGSNVAASSGIQVTFSAITTPDVSATGLYIVRTKDVNGKTIEENVQISGEGCLTLNSCSSHGTCTLFSHTCICDPGWGAATDVTLYRAPDCSSRVCPSGLSWNSVPTDQNTGAHNSKRECSGMGVCDRSTGKCVCFAGYIGAACDIMACPNNCNGRGRCVTMRQMAAIATATPLSPVTTYDGALATTTWDQDRIMGCVCDSSWSVGAGNGAIQRGEWFGADCSKRRCPIGDDPETAVDETDCTNKITPDGGFLTGSTGNKCYAECSNRGKCNYRTGLCTCLKGYAGAACNVKDALSQ